MSARTEKLLQHGSVEGMIEAVLKETGAGQLDSGGAFFDRADGFDAPELDFDDEDAA